MAAFRYYKFNFTAGSSTAIMVAEIELLTITGIDKTTGRGSFVTADGYHNSTLVPSNVVNDDGGVTQWQYNVAYPHWLQIDVGELCEISSYTITGSAQNTYNPTAWNLQGSVDGVTWTTIDTRTGQTIGAVEKKTYLTPYQTNRRVIGTVKDANGNFARRLVRAHRRDSGAFVGEVLSNPLTGAFEIGGLADYSKYYVVAHDTDCWLTYLPMNGADNSTVFYEYGGKPVTPNGNAKISTAQSKFGGASAYFDGNGDYLSMAASNDMAFGTVDFTIEAWLRPDSLGVERAIFDNRAVAGDTGLYFGINASNQIFCFGNNATIATGTSTAIASGAWSHVALVKDAGVIKLYLNGALVGSAASAYSISCASLALIGRKLGSTANYFAGYIDDFRISKGVARYTANFSVPTAAHSVDEKNAVIFDQLTPV